MLDAMRTLLRVGAASTAVGADQVRARLRHFPTRASEVDAKWLGSALSERFPGVRIRGLELLDDHSGTTSRARIGIDYESPGAADNPPQSVFLKITPHAPLQRLFLATFRIGRNEVRFYRDIRPDLPVRAPDVLGLSALPGDRQFVLVLEDLGLSEVVLATVGDRATRELAESVVDALAILHARFWQSDRFRSDLAWVPSYETRRRRDLPWERFITGQMCERALRRHASDFPPEFERIGRLCIDRRDDLERLWAEGPRTLVHGDCHLGNLFFEEGRTGFLDWQVCARAPGMRDVSYFLCNSLPAELRQECERELIDRYLEGIGTHGITPPDFPTAWRQHRLYALYTWIAATFTIAGGEGMQPLEIGLAGVRHATTAATELESVDFALDCI